MVPTAATLGDTRMPERFWRKVDATGSCWLWNASTNQGGYGQFKVGPRPHLAHRVAFEALAGPIPAGLQLDHLCRNRTCCNPAHLEPVTGRENVLRGDMFAARQVARTHCPAGHPLASDNLDAYELRHGRRKCKTCHRDRERARYRATRNS